MDILRVYISHKVKEYDQELSEKIKERKFYDHNKEWAEHVEEYQQKQFMKYNMYRIVIEIGLRKVTWLWVMIMNKRHLTSLTRECGTVMMINENKGFII